MFMRNPFPYLEVRRPFILGTAEKRWKATLAHRFAELLHKHTGKLSRIFTQNIDGLHEQCSEIPSEKIVAVHGTIGKAACEACGAKVDFNKFCNDVRRQIKDIYNIDQSAPKESTLIKCNSCGRATVKPTTVLYSGSIPDEFFRRAEEDIPDIDMLIVAGTSLVVTPVNSLVFRVPEKTIRVIVNKDPVGQRLGIEYGEGAVRDYFAQGNCEEVFLDLICELGWFDDVVKILNELPDDSAKLVMHRIAERSS